jgi:hypothetical protein
MAWIKFRFFEPISHPHCVVITPSSATPLVTWCAERALKGINHKDTLSKEQLLALQEACKITSDSYAVNEYQCIGHLAQRLVWGSPFQSAPPLPPAPVNPFLQHWHPATAAGPAGGIFGPGPLNGVLAFIPPRRQPRIHDRWETLDRIRDRITQKEALQLLSMDNELRTLAVLNMPEQDGNLNIKDSCELRIHFALQESAMKIMALTRSIEDTPKQSSGRR